MGEYSDKQIIDGLKNRQSNVVLFVTEAYLPSITLMIMRMGGNEQDGEDIFQEALMAIIKKVDKDQLVLTARFSTYFYAVCRNLRLCQISEKKREREYMYSYLKEVYYSEPSEYKTKESQENKFRYYFEQLSGVCKEILRLYTIKQSVKEIAEELGNTEKYIRKRKYECKNRLAKLVIENKDKVE